MTSALIATVSSAAELGCPGLAFADWFADVEAGILYDSNLGNGQFKQDIKADSALTLSTAAGYFVPVGDGGSFTIAADLRSQDFRSIPGMSNLSLGGTAAYKKKFGLGDLAPWLRLSLSADRLRFREDVRDGWLYQAATEGGKSIDNRWTLRAQYRYERRTAEHAVAADPDRSGAVFEQRFHSVTLALRLRARFDDAAVGELHGTQGRCRIHIVG